MFSTGDNITIEERLAQFPAGKMPVEKTVQIYWNDYQIPFIEAQTDSDAAFAMGLAHAHLRLGQIEVAKRLAQGRLSEMFGPFSNKVDAALRTLGIGRVAAQVLSGMPDDTRQWLRRYVEGINHYKKHLRRKTKPQEFKILGIPIDEPWTEADTICIGRIFGGDVNWLAWFDLLPMSEQEDFGRIWTYMHHVGSTGAVSFDNPKGIHPDMQSLREILQNTIRSGSNSIVIAGKRTENRMGMIANDPHLGMMMPNAWLIAGMKSPSYHIVGMMPPGVPVFGFGRTPDIAWGGTNMRALSSDLVDVSSLPPQSFSTDEETIKTRFWFNKKIKIRMSPYGPIISDCAIFPSMRKKPEVAVRWVGHQFSDEITALLGASRAKNGVQFQKALKDFAVPAQNFLYVDGKGHIGHVLATKLPKRSAPHKENMIQPIAISDAGWKTILDSTSLPHMKNPESGYLASGNNRPTQTEYPIGYFFPQDERIRRLHQILDHEHNISMDDLKLLQRDTVSLTSFELKNALIKKFESLNGRLGQRTGAVFDMIKEWDGSYTPHSKGAYVFTAFIIAYAPEFYGAIDRVEEYEIFKNDAYFRDLMRRALPEIKDEDFIRIVQYALRKAYPYHRNNNRWGSIHHLEVQHFLGRLPLIGRKFKKYRRSYGGTRETVMKAAHPLTMEPHRVYYGAQSRHISDMGDLDANYFVLVGGNDGWINSQNFGDQIDLWVRGDYIQMPLNIGKVRQLFPRKTTLQSK